MTGSGGMIALLIPPLIQILKRIPFLAKLQGNDIPVWDILSIALGIGGAYSLALPSPIVVGVLAGLAAGKGYDFVKLGQKGKKK